MTISRMLPHVSGSRKYKIALLACTRFIEVLQLWHGIRQVPYMYYKWLYQTGITQVSYRPNKTGYDSLSVLDGIERKMLGGGAAMVIRWTVWCLLYISLSLLYTLLTWKVNCSRLIRSKQFWDVTRPWPIYLAPKGTPSTKIMFLFAVFGRFVRKSLETLN